MIAMSPDLPAWQQAASQFERPLERIKFHDEWELMNWYVLMAQKQLNKMSKGEILLLQEEFMALEYKQSLVVNPHPLGVLEIEQIQKTILKHLQDLADGQGILIGEFRMTIWFNGKIRGRLPDPISWHWLHGDNQFIYHFGLLLEKWSASIRRCPHCSKIFLQLRRNAIYCGRECQSRAFMKKKRAEEKRRKPIRTKIRLSNRKDEHKGEAPHGKKTR